MEQFGLCQQYRKAVEDGRDPRRGAVRDGAQRPARRRRPQPAVPPDPRPDRHRPDRHQREPDAVPGSVRRRDARRVPCARPRRRARPRPSRRRARQRPVRADDPLARHRHLPEGRQQGDRHRRGDRRLRGAAPQPRPDGAARLPRRRGRRGALRRPPDLVLSRSTATTRRFHLEWAKVSRDAEQTQEFLRTLRARAGDAGGLSRRPSAAPARLMEVSRL